MENCVSRSERRHLRRDLAEYMSTELAECTEEGIYDYSEQFCGINNLSESLWGSVYRDKGQDILFNLGRGGEAMKEYLRGMRKGSQSGYNLAFLTPQELCPAVWKSTLDHIKCTQDTLANMPTIEREPCPECGCTYYFHQQHQTRSPDEPQTNFFICRECDTVTRINC